MAIDVKHINIDGWVSFYCVWWWMGGLAGVWMEDLGLPIKLDQIIYKECKYFMKESFRFWDKKHKQF